MLVGDTGGGEVSPRMSTRVQVALLIVAGLAIGLGLEMLLGWLVSRDHLGAVTRVLGGS